MDGDWEEVHRIVVPPSSYNEIASPASTLAFDVQQELLWVGNEYGRITSFFGPDLRKYTSYRGHPADEGPVKQLLFHERGVLSVAPKSIHLGSRKGLAQWHLTSEYAMDLCCMSFMGNNSGQVLVAGCQRVMLKIDVEKGRVLENIPTDYHYTAMKFCKYICSATSTGEINLLDVDSLRIVKTLTTNNVSISDLDARNPYLVSCGWTSRPQGTPMLATLANVFDLRSMVQLPPIPFHAGAAYVQMHPKMSTTCILASQTGQLQVVDLLNSNAVVNLKQVNSQSFMSKLVQAPSGEAIAIADVDGLIHLWGSPMKIQFSEYGNQAPEWGDTPEQTQFIDTDQDIPLNTIGMPYYREQLLSAWTSPVAYEVGNPPPKIDPLLLNGARAHDIGVWAPNPHKTRRNQAEKTRLPETNGSTIVAPKFLHEKARAPESSQDSEKHISEMQEAFLDAALSDSTKTDVPIMYRNVEIKYSRFGVDDFDFEYYNKTTHSGLETHITNSYTNSLLQVFKFTPIVRNLALHHTATCNTESCLLCEMGFLFDTLEKAEGQNCQATNFLKAFSGIPQAGRLGLLEESSHGNALSDMMQGACRFMLTQTADEFKMSAPQSTAFDQMMAIDALSSIRCTHCHNEIIRPGGTYVTDLVYQHVTPAPRLRHQIPTFSQVLKTSIELQIFNRGWCDKCHRYQQLATRKSVRGIPDVLTINAALKSSEAKQYWAIPGWLPASIGVLLENGKFFCFEGEDLRLHLQKRMHVIKVYDLVGIVADINSGEHQKSHLVSLINVTLSNRVPTDNSDWHLFNDFLVRKVSTEEALTFAASWKMPSVITFQSTSARHSIDDSWKNVLDTSLLYHDWSMNERPSQNCRVLDPATEAPSAGSFVAIDTEFVALQQEEIEIKADGEREIVRPTRLGLARVSVLRGSGEDEGLPFINDYITIREEIVDYLTKYSGVYQGDLDPKYSAHHLVPLKVAYKKLWLLLNLGCVFVGHGLPKDFRTINIHVPKAQVLDTVDLFYIRARQRKLSLRYLAWSLLKEEIQQDNHDSIEDARTALRLWRKYQEFHDAGVVGPVLEDVYREGKKYGYKPPAEAAAAAALAGAGRSSRSDLRSTDGGGASSTTNTATLGVPSALLDGRETPDILLQHAGHSGPGTPVGGGRGRRGAGGSGSGGGASTGARSVDEYFDSPLR